MAEPLFGSLAPYPEVLAKARGFFDEQPGWTYGSVLPMARGPEGQLRPAMPQAFRGAAQGYIDAVAGTQTGDLTPKATETLMFGSLVPGGPGMASGLGSVLSPIRAFHGSPHDFDKFDLSKIGTGEGAQVFGHGLYFAGSEDVARHYRDALSGKNAPFHAKVALKRGDDIGARIAETERDIRQRERIVSSARDSGDDIRVAQLQFGLDKDREKLLGLRQALEDPVSITGRMYEVGIDADPALLLDWDRPLVEQSANVVDVIRAHARPSTEEGMKGPLRRAAQAVEEGRLGDVEGRTAYTLLGGYHTPVEASERLRAAGVPGIRYLDQLSRDRGNGTSNYVVFDDQLIDIVRKYGLSGLGFGSLVPATLQQPNTAAKGDRQRYLSPDEA